MDQGEPAPLGASIQRGGVNFAVVSSVAEAVELCLFDRQGREKRRLSLPGRTGDTWHGYLPGIEAGTRYGYRVHGPWKPEAGLTCNYSKLLLDPYAREISGNLRWHPSLRGRSRADSAAFVPRSVVRQLDAGPVARPRIPWRDAVFYEANLRGYTMRHPAVPDAERGTFSGMRNAAVVDYIRSLGVTTVELLPVHAYVDERHLAKLGLRNYWGYNTIGFFAPMSRFATEDPVTEFRDMVRTFHDAGIEIVLDVVYNHTAEGNHEGPTLSFRGLDNAAYYRLHPGDRSHYIDDTGCGNTINADSDVVQKLVIDSLVYWHQDMGVDGFRFDLATVLGRHPQGFDARHPLLDAIATNPLLRNAKLVAEPWDPGPGGYRLGGFQKPWTELNDKFRDAARRFWRGDEKSSGELARRMHGSADVFEATGREPHASMNKVTSHDGFTLADVVSFENRHNEANGENNRDGHPQNYSRNYGVEGPTTDPAILSVRRRQRLNLLATLICAQGTPLLLAGDEFGNSQQGNNNAYAQDNETGWLDWAGLDDDPAFTEAVRELLSLRREYPLLRLDRYIHGSDARGDILTSVGWVNPDGRLRADEDWDFGHAFGLLLSEQAKGHTVSAVAVLLNAWTGPLEFSLAPLLPGCRWRLRFSSDGATLDSVSSRLQLPGQTIAIATGS